MRTKICNQDKLPEVLAISADNEEERKILLKIYESVLSELSKLHGKPIHPYGKAEARRRKIYSEQAPVAVEKRKEAYRKGNATRAKNKAIRKESET